MNTAALDWTLTGRNVLMGFGSVKALWLNACLIKGPDRVRCVIGLASHRTFWNFKAVLLQSKPDKCKPDKCNNFPCPELLYYVLYTIQNRISANRISAKTG